MDPNPPSSKDVATEAGPSTSPTLEAPATSREAESAVAAYLRSVKAPGPDTSPTATPQRSTQEGKERRRSIRYKCEGSAQFRVEGSEVRTWGALQDISLHGCYIEATAVSPVGTILHLLVEVNKIRVRAKGEVRVSYAFLGMGIAFIEIAEEERAHLRELLRSLSEAHALHQDPHNTAVTREQQPAPPLITDTASALNALLKFFQERSMLSRQDFWTLIRKSQPGN